MSADGEEESPRILSIQSTVVSGYVGNKVAVFPLQLHGFETSIINSVQLSNHTEISKNSNEISKSKTALWLNNLAYKYTKGQVLGASEIGELYEGLKLNHINNFKFILTGYMGSKSFIEKVAEAIAEMKKEHPDTQYLCDPVMGDNGKMYVPEELLPIYREKLLPLANITVPNQFEAELLTGTKISNIKDTIKAIDIIHSWGIKTVVMSSSTLGKGTNTLVCVGSSCTENGMERYKIEFPYINATFVGTGDLFSALILIWLHKDKNLKLALEKTVSILQYVIKKTVAYAEKYKSGDEVSFALMELKLIQSKGILENPDILYHAESIP